MNSLKIGFISLFSLLIFSVFLIRSERISGGTRDDGWMFKEAPAYSGFVAGLSPGHKSIVTAVFASTQTTGDIGEFFILVDSPAFTGTGTNVAGGMNSFASEQYRSPPTLFVISTMTVNGYYGTSLTKVLDYGAEGVTFSSAPYVVKSSTSSGQARKVFLQMRQ